MSEPYKGRWVDPRAYELSNGSGWDAEVYIAEDVGPETVDTQYSLTRTFPTKEAALEAALNAGKRKVDEIVRLDDIKSVIDDGTRLPSTYRRGHGTDDVAEGPDGLPTRVDRPSNPEDVFLK